LTRPVGVDDAERIVGPREPADLHEQRLVARHAERHEGLADFTRGEVAVALRERVDRRRDDVHRNAETALEAGQREDGGVELVDEAPDEGPHRGLRRRTIEVTAPYPPAGAPRAHEAHRLAVVHDRRVRLEVELLRVEAVHVDPAREALVAQHSLGALERRLQRPRGRVVRVVAAGDLPARVHAELAQDWHRCAQGLGGAAAEAAARHVQEPPALHLLDELEDEVDRAGWRDSAVVVEPAHRRASASAVSTRLNRRPRTRSRLVR
jgi:hypothetical protein